MFNLYINNFNISINKLKAEDFGESQGVLIKKFESDTDLFKIEPIIFLADPFLFSYNGRLYLFYERQDRWYGIGHICMRFTNDMQVWSDEIDVLKEAFHLSFPYVFEDNGKVYMLPEAGYSGTIRLYEACNDNLSKWKLSKVIIDEKRQWVDSSIIKRGQSTICLHLLKKKKFSINIYLSLIHLTAHIKSTLGLRFIQVMIMAETEVLYSLSMIGCIALLKFVFQVMEKTLL